MILKVEGYSRFALTGERASGFRIWDFGLRIWDHKKTCLVSTGQYGAAVYVEDLAGDVARPIGKKETNG
jgi:hypothetical protein